MRNQSGLVTWIAMAVVVVGIVAIVAMTLQSAPAPDPLPTKMVDTPLPTGGPTATPTPVATVALPTVTPTPVPLKLPSIAPPPGGQIYTLTPVAAGAVGWAESGDAKPNHFGDFNIYAGVYNGKVRVGAFQFDLSSIPPGAPIIHADLTLIGLSDQFLHPGGSWSVQLLQNWIDQDWSQRDFYWLNRADSSAGDLEFPATTNDVGPRKQNTFFFKPEQLPLLEARLYRGTVSFRVMGPDQGDNNLFAWDAGFGAGSLARPPLLRIVAGPAPGVAPPSPTPNYVIITPIGANIIALARERLTATAQATAYTGPGTPTPTPTDTPLPPNWVTPLIITNTPVPESPPTAVYQNMVATAQAVVFGTPTPLPVNVWTATPTPLIQDTPTPPFVLYDQLTATPTPTATPTGIPSYLRGKILFRSDRTGNGDKGALMFMNPDGSEPSVLTTTDNWVYAEAVRRENVSPDGRFKVVVSDNQLDLFPDHKLDTFKLFVIPIVDQGRPFRLPVGGMCYDAVWSPTDYRIAFVSTAPGNDEIYTIRPDGSDLQRLTTNQWEWDKHPSWSSDGTQIVFWSNRGTARRQIWMMNADGSNQHNISNNTFNDWDRCG